VAQEWLRAGKLNPAISNELVQIGVPISNLKLQDALPFAALARPSTMR
jgi:hypothetical protein